MEIIRQATILNIDCMEYMSTVPDNHFDLAIVDPPYGLKRFRKGVGKGRIKVKVGRGLVYSRCEPV